MSVTKQKDVIEEIKEIIRDLGESQKRIQEAHEQAQKTHEQAQKEMQEIREAQQKTEKAQQETKKIQQETEKSLRELGKSLSDTNTRFNNKWGHFVENLVEGDLVNLLQKRGMKIVRVQPRMKYPKTEENRGGELDLVAVNGDMLVAVEVKATLEKPNVYDFIEKLGRFKKAPTEYKDKEIFAGVAYLKAEYEADELAEKLGLFVIKAPGGKSQFSTITNTEGFKPKSFGKTAGPSGSTS